MSCPSAPSYLKPSAPVTIPDCCAWPPPATLSMSLDTQRDNAVICTVAALAHQSLTLTFDGVNQYTGSFVYLGDTFNVTLTYSGGVWTLQMTDPSAGCGFENLFYNESGSPLTGPWPDANLTGPGVCGCVDLWFNYTNIVIS